MLQVILIILLLISVLAFLFFFLKYRSDFKEHINIIEHLNGENQMLNQELKLFNSLMDNIPDTIYFKDLTSKFTKINRTQARLIGAPNPEWAIGKDDFDFFPKEMAEVAFNDEQEFIRKGEPIIGKIEHIGDEVFEWASATKVPIKDEDDNVIGLVGITRNITQQKKAEERIIKAVEEVATAMNEIASSSSQIAANIEQSQNYSKEVQTLVKEGNGLKNEVVEKVSNTNDSIGDISNAMEKLTSDNLEIERLVELISDVADRTNVISLNAAIEAANAGEHGLGFNQIASEVRVLSDKSAELARNIRELAQNTRANTNSVGNVVKESIVYSTESVRQMEFLGQSLNKIFAATEHISQMLGEIMISTRQQAESTAQIDHQLKEISVVSKVTEN